jgi:hypothetical protein
MSVQTFPEIVCALHQTAMDVRANGPFDYLCSSCAAQAIAADELAKAARVFEGVEIGTHLWWTLEKEFFDALAAYEKVRGHKTTT